MEVDVGNKLFDYVLVEDLGQGNYGSVCLVKSKLTNKLYAMKEISQERYNNEEQRKEFQNELKLLENFDCPNVIKYFTSFRENENFYIVSEYMNRGSLALLINEYQKRKYVNEKLVWRFLVQSICGLRKLHKNQKIIHKNIKPENLLLDKELNLKITDYGISAIDKKDSSEYLQYKDSKQYIPPEIVNGGNFDFKSDVYMLGITFYKIISGKFPTIKYEEEKGIHIVKKDNNSSIPNIYSQNL